MKRRIVSVISLECGKQVMKDIIKMLAGKTFSVVTSHSGYAEDTAAFEDLRLKSAEPIVEGSVIRILLDPSKSLAFDVAKDNPVVIFESDRQLRILRRLPKGYRLVKTILINPCNVEI